MPVKWWRAEAEWLGHPAFIIGGGPSVRSLDLSVLRGRKIIAINSSFETVPFADILFFADTRWYRAHKLGVKAFKGRVVTLSTTAYDDDRKRILPMMAQKVVGLAVERTKLAMERTSMQAAINLAVHLGANPIVTIGLDGKAGSKGRTHHHPPHPWPLRPDCWHAQRANLLSMVKPLKRMGIEVLNASPDSAIDFWPRMTLEEATTWRGC